MKHRSSSKKDPSEFLGSCGGAAWPFVVSHRGLLSAGNQTQWLQKKVLYSDIFSQQQRDYFWNLALDLGLYGELWASLFSSVPGNAVLRESCSTHLRPKSWAWHEGQSLCRLQGSRGELVFVCWVSYRDQQVDQNGIKALPSAQLHTVRGIILTALNIQVSGPGSILEVVHELLLSQDKYMALTTV